MIEVNEKNFETLFPQIEKALKSAAFVSVDSEFSGIKKSSSPDYTFFDTLDERYEKTRINIKDYSAVQIGLSTFRYIVNDNSYEVETYSFYLLPKSTPFEETEISWEYAALEFLTKHNFNFNKLYYESIPYLDKQREMTLRNHLKSNDLGSFSSSILDDVDNEEKFIAVIDRVSSWLNNSKPDEKHIEIECTGKPQKIYIQKELRSSFKTIWTEEKDDKIIVIKISPETHRSLVEKDNNSLEKKLIDYYEGFSKVFKLLIASKKPIIGHNILLDLMFLYKQFHQPLPSRYTEFKAEIHKLFPVIYDTKFISYELIRSIKDDIFKSNILSDLYAFFNDGIGRGYVYKSPNVYFANGYKIEKEMYHDAGWDSYCTGFCFIKVAYMLITEKRKRLKMNDSIELTNHEILHGVNEYVNCVNIIKGNISYIRLDGEDPASNRPPWLNITAKNSTRINIKEISNILSKFKPITIKLQSKQSALIAAPNYRSAREILHYFQRHKDYKIAVYSPSKQSFIFKSIFWSSIFVSGGLITWFIHKRIASSDF